MEEEMHFLYYYWNDVFAVQAYSHDGDYDVLPKTELLSLGSSLNYDEITKEDIYYMYHLSSIGKYAVLRAFQKECLNERGDDKGIQMVYPKEGYVGSDIPFPCWDSSLDSAVGKVKSPEKLKTLPLPKLNEKALMKLLIAFYRLLFNARSSSKKICITTSNYSYEQFSQIANFLVEWIPDSYKKSFIFMAKREVTEQDSLFNVIYCETSHLTEGITFCLDDLFTDGMDYETEDENEYLTWMREMIASYQSDKEFFNLSLKSLNDVLGKKYYMGMEPAVNDMLNPCEDIIEEVNDENETEVITDIIKGETPDNEQSGEEGVTDGERSNEVENKRVQTVVQEVPRRVQRSFELLSRAFAGFFKGED